MKSQNHILLTLLLVSGIALAQKGNLRHVNKLFEMRAYTEAAKIYETKSRSMEVLQNLADSYYYNSNLENAIKTYKELFEKYGNTVDAEYGFKYAQALKGIGNYTEADKYLSKYYNKTISTNTFITGLEAHIPHTFTLQQIENKTGTSDFGLSFYNQDKVVFSSTRNKHNPEYLWNKLPYLDLYSATLNNNVLENVTAFSKTINTTSHESNAVFTKDGKTMYFNRTNPSRKKINKKRVAQIKIYKAELINGDWTNIVALPFTSDNYSTEHPALSKDEKTLYFASDMEGSFGDFDIYKVAINNDGTYGQPENLGEVINTKHREQFPFISDYNVLYFSSIGHEGFGGLDVFRSEIVNNSYTTPLNLGASINSGLDDFSYVVRENEDKGFISSNRNGNDAVYVFSRKDAILKTNEAEGVVQDKNTKALLKGALVTLLDSSNTIIEEVTVAENGCYLFKIQPNKKYKIKATNKGYIPEEVEFETNQKGKTQYDFNLNLQSFADAEKQIIENEKGEVKVHLDKIYFNFDSFKIKEKESITLNNLVRLMKKYPTMQIEISGHTDAIGTSSYNLKLSKQRAVSTLNYLVSQGIQKSRLKSIGYGEAQPLNKCIKETGCDDDEFADNRRCEFIILN